MVLLHLGLRNEELTRLAEVVGEGLRPHTAFAAADILLVQYRLEACIGLVRLTCRLNLINKSKNCAKTQTSYLNMFGKSSERVRLSMNHSC